MGIFNSTCCPPKPKRTMDYILNWIDTNSLIISKNTSFINDLIEWRRSIENNLKDYVKDVANEYITEYDWSQVPQFDTLSRSIAAKADKAVNAVNGHFASLDANGNLQDSGKEASDFAEAQHYHSSIEKSKGNLNSMVAVSANDGQGAYIQLTVTGSDLPTKSIYIDRNNIDYLETLLSGIAHYPSESGQLIDSNAVFKALQGKVDSAPKTLSMGINRSAQEVYNWFVPRSAGTTNLWLSCQTNKCYQVAVTFEDMQEETSNKVLCTCIASDSEQGYPQLELYFGLHTILISGDGEWTSDQIRRGEVKPSDVVWDVAAVDNSWVFKITS